MKLYLIHNTSNIILFINLKFVLIKFIKQYLENFRIKIQIKKKRQKKNLKKFQKLILFYPMLQKEKNMMISENSVINLVDFHQEVVPLGLEMEVITDQHLISSLMILMQEMYLRTFSVGKILLKILESSVLISMMIIGLVIIKALFKMMISLREWVHRTSCLIIILEVMGQIQIQIKILQQVPFLIIILLQEVYQEEKKQQ